jgi:hypothetical protein
MIPNATISTKRTADTSISGKLTAEMFEGNETQLCRSNGHCTRTSLQNRDLLKILS